MKMKNGFDNDIIVGIDIGSENIFCSIGSISNALILLLLFG